MATANIIFGIVMLHLLAGFGWVLWKISAKSNPKKGDQAPPAA